MSDDAVRVEAATGAVAAAVLRRVAVALGAQNDLPVDRLRDVELLLQALLARHHGERVRVSFSSDASGLTLTLGPVARHAAAELLERSRDPDLGPILERLADRVSVDRNDGDEYLRMTLGRAAAPTG